MERTAALAMDSAPKTTLSEDKVLPDQPRRPSRWWSLLRWILLDIPLALLFATFLLVGVLCEIHQTYYKPLFDRAERTDHDLLSEYTYYNRECNEYDLSTRNIQDLFVNETAPIVDSVDQMLTHGAMVIPKVLRLSTVKRLREYIVARNAAIPEAEKYPVSQGYNRLSYGIDATEHPAVTSAIAEVANNPLVRDILRQLLGDDDPASAEITAITAYYGSPDQAWHGDTKSDGNALKFARTYSHSYSFFMPLQDTTAAMGATDLCPGTHYCANDLSVMCEANTMGLNEATPEKVFRAGDGALLNQHVWHRGSGHTDPSATERVVFILSFLARPKIGDPRQLSRGTYFHQRYLMWGHTWKDLMNPMRSMRKPLSILRCLRLWKPVSYNWGYDLVTATFLRFANNQLEYEDLPYRLVPRLDALHFPKFLRGDVREDLEQKPAWEIFLQGTFDKTYAFAQKINLGGHAVYLVLVLLGATVSARRNKRGVVVLRNAVCRLFVTHGILFAVAYLALHRIKWSEWGRSVLTGRMLMRPFPEIDLSRWDEGLVSKGPTTLPDRQDALIGTRYDARFLGSYDQWLDYHPGSTAFQQASAQLSMLYRKNLDPALKSSLIQQVQSVVTRNGGRFLIQDYRSGDWRVMSREETRDAIQGELAAASSLVIRKVRKEIDYAIADCRFGDHRSTVMAQLGQLRLWQLRRALLGLDRNQSSIVDALPRLKQDLWVPSHLSRTGRTKMEDRRSKSLWKRASSTPAEFAATVQFRTGVNVWAYFEQEDFWYPGTIIDCDPEHQVFYLTYNDGTEEQEVEQDRLALRSPLTEGDAVLACYDDAYTECYEGELARVMPNGAATVYFPADGSMEWHMQLGEFFVPPYKTPGIFANADYL